MILLSIQYLRAAAALLVVFYHMEVQLRRWGDTGYWPHALAGGVDIFFVISGFIIWTVTSGRPVTARQFLARRAERVVPLYWALTTVAVVAGFVQPALVRSGGFDLLHVAASYGFVAAQHPALHVPEPVVVPGWTLNYEMFFYAVFGLMLPLPPVGRLLAVGGVLGGLVLVGRVAGVQPDTVAGFYTDDIMLEFLLGMGLGAVSATGWRVGAAAAAACFLAGALGLFAGGEFGRSLPRIMVVGVPALMIVGGALMLERSGRLPVWRLPRLIGDASYSIYLTHAWVLSLAGQGWTRMHADTVPGGWVGYVLVSLAAAILCGVTIHALVERPCQEFLRRRRLGRTTGPAPHRIQGLT